MTVYLVGAGPGDPGLLTLRAAALLGRADVVLFDRLVDRRVLELVGAGAELVDVGKRHHDPEATTQERINQLLVAYGATHDVVVRLKGGDPFLFGRGAEELAALSAAGIATEVVPGISSALGVPAAAGIAVTMRGVASQVTVVTGHDVADGNVDWRQLAGSMTTLVVLMPVAQLAQIERALLDAGLAASTPCAVIERGCTPDERLRTTSLSRLHDVDAAPPALLVIGEVVNHRLEPLPALAVAAALHADA